MTEKDKNEKKKNTKEETDDNKVEIHRDEKKHVKELSEIEKLKKQNDEYRDALLRKMAEFENYKKRTETEFENIYKYSSEKVIKKLLPVIDDFNRSVSSIEKGETKDFDMLKTGFIAIKEKFLKILEKEGIKEIDVLNSEFDVNLCDALLQVPKDDVKPNTVVEVVEKGYYFKDKVIRHAKVIVSSENKE
jgi:molecular chaperone GrpE